MAYHRRVCFGESAFSGHILVIEVAGIGCYIYLITYLFSYFSKALGEMWSENGVAVLISQNSSSLLYLSYQCEVIMKR